MADEKPDLIAIHERFGEVVIELWGAKAWFAKRYQQHCGGVVTEAVEKTRKTRRAFRRISDKIVEIERKIDWMFQQDMGGLSSPAVIAPLRVEATTAYAGFALLVQVLKDLSVQPSTSATWFAEFFPTERILELVEKQEDLEFLVSTLVDATDNDLRDRVQVLEARLEVCGL